MNKNSKVFNIYCDESRVDNTDSHFMVIGAIVIPRESKELIFNDIKILFEEHKYSGELKWTKVGAKFINFYKAIIDYFVASDNLQYRCIVVDKRNVKYSQFHNNDKELAFFKFYYLLLKSKLSASCKYYIFIDKRPTNDKNRARSLHAYLNTHIYLNKPGCSVEHLQAYSSHENLLIQICDFFTGTIGFALNTELDKRSATKQELSIYLKDKIGIKSYLKCSSLFEEKFNIFHWRSNE